MSTAPGGTGDQDHAVPAGVLGQRFDRQWAVLLSSRRRDGTWVATPVNIAMDDEEAVRAAGLLRRKYPLVYGLVVPVELRIRRARGLTYEPTGFGTATPALPARGQPSSERTSENQ